MTFPDIFDAYVPSNGPDFLAVSNITPTYVPFETLRAVSINGTAEAATFAYAKKLTPPAAFAHVLRCFYFALALLYTGFPSGTPGIAQIGFAELSMRLYHTTLLHDIGWTTNAVALEHPAHAMTFELYGARMAYEHLHAAAPALNADQVGDIVQSIVLHTSQWPVGNSSATQILMSLSAVFDIGGFNGTTIGGLNWTSLFHPKTIAEIEAAYPRGDFFDTGRDEFDREFAQKPNCLVSHLGGLDALLTDLRVGPIVPGDLDSRARNVRALKEPHLRHLD